MSQLMLSSQFKYERTRKPIIPFLPRLRVFSMQEAINRGLNKHFEKQKNGSISLEGAASLQEYRLHSFIISSIHSPLLSQ